MLELENVTKIVDGDLHADNISASFSSDAINIILGPTGSGKTTLMRLIAGLDSPDSGTLRFNKKDISRLPVQRRDVAMVYQQFINYPSLTVFENIASPLRLKRIPAAEIDSRVKEAAKILKLSDYLERMPPELSGGQQQRVALARALVKNAKIVLLDEPLANLDYKLREELREELPEYFSAQGAVLIYATTEPSEALLLGGNTFVFHEASLIQKGATREVFQSPENLACAQAFSDPPMNTIDAIFSGDRIKIPQMKLVFNMRAQGLAEGAYTLGIRPYHLRLTRETEDDIELLGKVIINEITGSQSILHIEFDHTRFIAITNGVHDAQPDQTLACYADPNDFFLFDNAGDIARLPRRKGT